MTIRERLFEQSDGNYKNFQSALVPTVPKSKVIGVRMPIIKRIARELCKEGKAGEFISELPHEYFDENVLHAQLISQTRDFDECVRLIDEFLPYVDNWAVCDSMLPVVLKRNKPELKKKIYEWISGDGEYTVRYGILMLMKHFLGEDFSSEHPMTVSKIKSERYYVKMMIAWYFASALTEQYECAVRFIEGQLLDAWTHNKSIQKAIESRRIPAERKDYLKTLKR